MNFIRTTTPDLHKDISVIENKGGESIIKGNYSSILDMPKEEMMIYITQAFAETPEMSELWARQCMETVAMRNRAIARHQ
ncbi:MAG: hypothetical protein IKZ64_01965 [Alphaproteobacteria bacterium]|nr:hypothetical protein [Alphaproteobacteria bacterium]